MGTPDGKWRVEVVRVGREQQYRVFRDGELLPYRGAMGTVERLLHEDGYTMADLIEVADPATAGAS
ncbi:hypothetical protein Adu01nite_47470 [Paractinoplanes durhamensis]|uniref:Uncharacterized protein n=2 Tax=Paractinoplanes durhamensis TaxID=113563 RepID=A0ABQ3Z0N9_9ACTN|nr:hypothetical protein Adu01nite_47470 [Actinoplanes durhamensis]